MNALVESLIGNDPSAAVAPNSVAVRALAWARVSTDMQEERGLSIPEQQRQIREYAEAHGIEIVEEYHEAASAFKKESQRVEFHRMLDRAKSDRDISAILVHDFSRFSRDSLRARTLIRELKQKGIKVVSLNDIEIDPESVAGVYMEAITFAKNEAYSREVAFHTKKGCRANVQTRDPETGWCYKNGGQPLWGYRAERLIRGEEKKGRPLIKCIWVPDDRIVAGKPVYEWAKECLQMASTGATLDQLRDFCNKNGIPAQRQQYWGSTTWHSLLHPNCLLQYAGYGVWNVRGKSQRFNPPTDWVITENAHQPLIDESLVQRIIESRKGRSCARFGNTTSNRSHSTPYLLSGGLFVCERCGSNLMGFKKTKDHAYYICGSLPHRRGLGCGQAVYVPQQEIEREVIAGLTDLAGFCGDPDGFTRQVNAELRRIWQESTGYDPSLPRRIGDIDAKIANIRKAVEDGLPDSEWAYTRMRELMEEKSALESQPKATGKAPQVDAATALAYRRQTEKVLAQGTNAERKQIIRTWVDKITLAPDTLEVQINYRVPEPLVLRVGAGGGFEPPTSGL
jgi:site-specific DNA recombinase